MINKGAFIIKTSMSYEELFPLIKKRQPWRSEIVFSNGINTKDFETFKPFNRHPILKLEIVKEYLDSINFKPKLALDVGFNYGYNSIGIHQAYRCKVIGIDITDSHLETANFLSSLANVSDIEFRIEDANLFLKENYFDFILHFGTLYHLPNPLLAIENSYKNLKAGGILALETTTYCAEDEYACKFINGFKSDRTNFWALSKRTIEYCLKFYGFTDIKLLKEVNTEYIGSDMSRVIYVAHKL
jgi:SAM-dependent methyltransferase